MEFKLDDDGDCWTARVRLRSWAGFQDRTRSYRGEVSDSDIDGTVQIIIEPQEGNAAPLSEEELLLVQWLIDNESRVSQAVRDAIFTRYPTLRAEYLDESLADAMPELSAPDDLKGLIGLYNVHIHPITRDGIPYIGFELACSWDHEHGLGLMMHDTRVVDFGGADSAFLFWIAKQDAERH